MANKKVRTMCYTQEAFDQLATSEEVDLVSITPGGTFVRYKSGVKYKVQIVPGLPPAVPVKKATNQGKGLRDAKGRFITFSNLHPSTESTGVYPTPPDFPAPGTAIPVEDCPPDIQQQFKDIAEGKCNSYIWNDLEKMWEPKIKEVLPTTFVQEGIANDQVNGTTGLGEAFSQVTSQPKVLKGGNYVLTNSLGQIMGNFTPTEVKLDHVPKPINPTASPDCGKFIEGEEYFFPPLPDEAYVPDPEVTKLCAAMQKELDLTLVNLNIVIRKMTKYTEKLLRTGLGKKGCKKFHKKLAKKLKKLRKRYNLPKE